MFETSEPLAEEIVKYANANNIRLVAMSTHGCERAVASGIVAERVVATAPCPMLTVRHPEDEFVMPDAADATANQKRGALP